MSSTQKPVAPPAGFVAKFAAALLFRIRRLFRKSSADNPNIYPFF
jgi:hypothetical protein